MRRAALLLTVVLLVGCGGDDGPGDPGEFAGRVIRLLGSGQSGRAWDLLHPLHRERVPRALYVRCERGDGFGGTVTNIEVLEVKEEPATIAGQFGRRPSTAVTVGITLDTPEADAPEKFSLTVHLFENDEGWSWVIGPVDYAAYMTGVCPA